MSGRNSPTGLRPVGLLLLVSLLLIPILSLLPVRTSAQSTPTRPALDAIPTPVGMPDPAMFGRRYRSRQVPAAAEGSLRWRTGVGVPIVGPLAFLWPKERPGWYVSWSVQPVEGQQPFPAAAAIRMDAPEYDRLGMEFVPLVKMLDGRPYHAPGDLTTMAANNPGRTWIIGNEPDVAWQDNTTAPHYAHAYHDAYHAIKAGDPTAHVAIGAVSQVTPLRLTYLNRVWDAYNKAYGEPMPVDVWTMHAYILREELGNWGVGIPPGFELVTRGVLWDVEDHDNLALVENQIRLMRSWMARHQQGDKPLWVTEYGILLPPEYGYDQPRIEQFMLDSFALFDTLRHPRLGMAADDDRLVQRWNWFSAYYEPFPSSDLFDAQGLPGPLMETLSDVIAGERALK